MAISSEGAVASTVYGKISDFIAVAVKCPRKGCSLKTTARTGIRGNDCRRKDLPFHINIRRQDKALTVICGSASQIQQVVHIGDLIWVVRFTSAAAVSACPNTACK